MRFESKNALRFIPLGGIGEVTKNMYLYEYGEEIVVVDCGVGFPDETLPGIDLIIPDVSYLLARKEKIRGIILTHGHDDHIGALPYILPKLGNVPVFASRLTAGLAEVKLKEFGIAQKINLIDVDHLLKLGNFNLEFIHVTHSVPDASNIVLETPVGNFYHASDFKFDWTPVDGRYTEVGKIAQAGKKGIVCLFSDCLRSEKTGYTLSEKMIEETLEREVRGCRGKFIVTTHSSNISRLQQAINVSLRNGRKICFVGRSLEQNIEVAERLGFIQFPRQEIVRVEFVSKLPSKLITLLVAGSQGQENSALARIAYGEHRFIKIKPEDVVVFSADPIPGNEGAIHSLIDTLTKLGAKVSYSEVLEDLHVSGHASQNELMLMIGLTRPNFLLPIGGTFRQMKQYSLLAQTMGYPEKQILLLENGQVVEFTKDGGVHFPARIETKNILVDGLGVGDVGNIVLRDRKTMAEDGIVVVIVPIEQATGQAAAEPDIVSRGFVYMKESGKLIQQAKEVVKQCLIAHRGQVSNWQFLRRHIEENLEEFLYRQTQRRPLILPVLVEV